MYTYVSDVIAEVRGGTLVGYSMKNGRGGSQCYRTTCGRVLRLWEGKRWLRQHTTYNPLTHTHPIVEGNNWIAPTVTQCHRSDMNDV